MANNRKPVIFFAAAAWAVSFLFGIIGGVGFGAIILRSLLSALIFGGLAFGADRLLRGFLPELFQNGEENGRAGAVDIVMPEVNPHEWVSENPGGGGQDELPDFPDDGADGVYEADEESDDLVEEIEELPQSEAEPNNSPQESAAAKDPEENVEYLDALPDVDELNGSFGGSGTQSAAGEGNELSDISLFSGGTGDKDKQDPAIMAKTLQTILKKENER
jgi:hypothetical protein